MKTQYDLVKSKIFRSKADKGIISQEGLKNIFIKTSLELSKGKHKAGCLLYPGYPREHELKQVMSTVLSGLGYNHMVERPVKNPMPEKLKVNKAFFIDLSIYTSEGLIDIEFKKSLDDIDRDFPKLFDSPAIGCAIFYIFKHNRIDFALTEKILSKYQTVYDRIKNEFAEQNTIIQKWFQFCLCAFKERRLFVNCYQNITKIDFSEVANNEQNLLSPSDNEPICREPVQQDFMDLNPPSSN